MVKAINTRNQKVLASSVEVADSLPSRMIGLMGRKNLESGHGMLIKRSGNSIHTFFMRFPIDLVFIDAKGQVRWIRKNLTPWKVAFAPLMVITDCLELPGGTVENTETQLGDVILVQS